MISAARTPVCLLLAGITAYACLPTDVCGCPPSTFVAVLYGRVADPAGVPVPGVGIVPELSGPGCAGEVDRLDIGGSGVDGRYRVYLRAVTEPLPGACLRARVCGERVGSWSQRPSRLRCASAWTRRWTVPASISF